MPTFVVQWPGGNVPDNEQQDVVFQALTKEADRLKLWPVVRWRNEKEGEFILRFVRKQEPPLVIRKLTMRCSSLPLLV